MCHCALVFEPHHPSALSLLWDVTSVPVSHRSLIQGNARKGFVGLFISPKDLNQGRDLFAVLFPQAAAKAATCRNSHSPRSVHVK